MLGYHRLWRLCIHRMGPSDVRCKLRDLSTRCSLSVHVHSRLWLSSGSSMSLTIPRSGRQKRMPVSAPALILALISVSLAQTICPYVSVSSCTGLTQTQCVNSFYNPGLAGSYAKHPCAWSGTACSQSSNNCIQYCAGSTELITCGQDTNTSTCADYYTYTLSSGVGGFPIYTYYDCNLVSGACATTTPKEQCSPYTAATCTGTYYAAGCSAITSQTTCLASHQTGAHGGSWQCGYTAGVGCYPKVPCHL